MKLMDALKSVRLTKKQEALHPLTTRWGDALDPSHVLQAYPRPQMRRASYQSLNGYWSYAITTQATCPKTFDGQILVPFSPEASLSGVNRQVQPHEYLWYETTYSFEKQTGRCLLHIDALDQSGVVYINQKKVARHTGGYLPFVVDITEELAEPTCIQIRVQDVSDTSYLSKGKQRLKRGGMYYTAQSGIWQSVWVEWVSDIYIKQALLTPDLDQASIRVELDTSQPYDEPVKYELWLKGELLSQKFGHTKQTLSVPNVQPWTPDTPTLYDLKIQLGEDEVTCYFAMRCFSIEEDEHHIPRVCLNHQPYFMNGVLDQGYWPDGLYTAPSDEAMVYDITMMKRLGYCMLRKHCKVEPSRWYYHCDRLGMIVWQDMVNAGTSYHTWFVTWMPSLLSWTKKHIRDTHTYLFSRTQGKEEWIKECQETIQHLRVFPCISTWVIFNEGWGQFDTLQMTKRIREQDPTRLIDSASGWFDQGCGDFRSEHHYFDKPKLIKDHRAFVISEYGGYACQLKGHSSVDKIYGYHTYESCETFTEAYHELQEQMVTSFIDQGLCGAVYTQVSDIEEEVNGLLSYDREVCKVTTLQKK